MGYTHYMKPMKRALTKEEIKVIKSIIKLSVVDIVSGNGEKGTEPAVKKDFINLNGVGDEGHESFQLYLDNKDFNFCKTAQKPYDVVVVAILTYLDSIGVLTWSSDGEKEDHAEGVKLTKQAMKEVGI